MNVITLLKTACEIIYTRCSDTMAIVIFIVGATANLETSQHTRRGNPVPPRQGRRYDALDDNGKNWDADLRRAQEKFPPRYLAMPAPVRTFDRALEKSCSKLLSTMDD